MLTFFANNTFLSLLLIIGAGVTIYTILDRVRVKREEGWALARIKAEAANFNGNWPGGTEALPGRNWQLICPDCGTYNVMHRPAGIACRHCAGEPSAATAGEPSGARCTRPASCPS